jgi:hypothetical protein
MEIDKDDTGTLSFKEITNFLLEKRIKDEDDSE